MTEPTSVASLDLSPLPRKTYWSVDREWREDFIYFLLVDRFDDNTVRAPERTSARASSVGTPDQLHRFCGGKIAGITANLNYLADLGCTALWLSPIFECNGAPDPTSQNTYHGYATQNYLRIDPRFGTKQDLVDLVDAAHARGMRVYLDAVLNHSGDNWSYPGDAPYYYFDDVQFPFGDWRFPDRPVPTELRDPAAYHRRGQIQHWDASPEYQRGDFFGDKDFENDEDEMGRRVQRALVACYCYWIREADVDGFRLDACKHIGVTAIERFCSAIREYAYSIGKGKVFLFGELITGDDAIDQYIGPSTTAGSDDSVAYGLTSALDFPLYGVVPSAIKALAPPDGLIERYDALHAHAVARGDVGRYLVTFLDNHDQVGENYKLRFGARTPDAQIIAGVGFLLCAPGTTCLYYGTEQGLSGEGPDDRYIREPLFSLEDATVTYLNPACGIYQEIAKIAAVFRKTDALRFGRIYFRPISGDSVHFGLPQGQPCTLAYSRILAGDEVLVAYNTSTTYSRSDAVVVDATLHAGKTTMTYLYGGTGTVPIEAAADGTAFVRPTLAPMQFVILQ